MGFKKTYCFGQISVFEAYFLWKNGACPCASADCSGGDKSMRRHPPRNTWTTSHQNLPHPSQDSHSVPEGAAEWSWRWATLYLHSYLYKGEPSPAAAAAWTDGRIHSLTLTFVQHPLCVSRFGWKLVANFFLIKARCLRWWQNRVISRSTWNILDFCERKRVLALLFCLIEQQPTCLIHQVLMDIKGQIGHEMLLLLLLVSHSLLDP